MGAEPFTVAPSPARGVGDRRSAGVPARLRQVHRWTSIAFTLMVLANVAAMVRGPAPAVITYAPLPPLLILAITGLAMFARHALPARHRACPDETTA